VLTLLVEASLIGPPTPQLILVHGPGLNHVTVAVTVTMTVLVQ
jgi:hypothetical protein